MKTVSIQLPARISKRIPASSAGCPRVSVRPALLTKGSRQPCWYRLFRSLQAVLSGLLDSSAYQQISLGREISVAFTSQGPVVYRPGLIKHR